MRAGQLYQGSGAFMPAKTKVRFADGVGNLTRRRTVPILRDGNAGYSMRFVRST